MAHPFSDPPAVDPMVPPEYAVGGAFRPPSIDENSVAAAGRPGSSGDVAAPVQADQPAPAMASTDPSVTIHDLIVVDNVPSVDDPSSSRCRGSPRPRTRAGHACGRERGGIQRWRTTSRVGRGVYRAIRQRNVRSVGRRGSQVALLVRRRGEPGRDSTTSPRRTVRWNNLSRTGRCLHCAAGRSST